MSTVTEEQPAAAPPMRDRPMASPWSPCRAQPPWRTVRRRARTLGHEPSAQTVQPSRRRRREAGAHRGLDGRRDAPSWRRHRRSRRSNGSNRDARWRSWRPVRQARTRKPHARARSISVTTRSGCSRNRARDRPRLSTSCATCANESVSETMATGPRASCARVTGGSALMATTVCPDGCSDGVLPDRCAGPSPACRRK
jgi:hypothetical protein